MEGQCERFSTDWNPDLRGIACLTAAETLPGLVATWGLRGRKRGLVPGAPDTGRRCPSAAAPDRAG